VLQPLRKIAKGLDVQSKVVKEITSSIKQLQTQIIQIQKVFKREQLEDSNDDNTYI